MRHRNAPFDLTAGSGEFTQQLIVLCVAGQPLSPTAKTRLDAVVNSCRRYHRLAGKPWHAPADDTSSPQWCRSVPAHSSEGLI
jgi:hypothetical protein